jgi:DNA gyrase subunit A
VFKHLRRNGINAITLNEGDELMFVEKTDSTKDIFVATNDGRCIRFDEKEVSVMGRNARGVRAIRLSDSQVVAGALSLDKDSDKLILTITQNGFGKRSDPASFTAHHRGGSGMACHKLSEKTGLLSGIAAVEDSDDIMIITDSGMLIRIPVSQISVIGRTASGVIIMRTSDNAVITGFQVIQKDDNVTDTVIDEDVEELSFSDTDSDSDSDSDLEIAPEA